MKKMSLLLLASFAFTVTVSAQGGGFQRRTVEERVATIHAKMDSAFKLDATKLAEVGSSPVFFDCHIQLINPSHYFTWI